MVIGRRRVSGGAERKINNEMGGWRRRAALRVSVSERRLSATLFIIKWHSGGIPKPHRQGLDDGHDFVCPHPVPRVSRLL